MDPLYRILLLLQQNNIQYELRKHEAVFTSEQAASIRGLSLSSGAKSLLLKAADQFYLFVLPGDKKLDTKKIREMVKSKNIRFATPEEVEAVTGTQIGAVYPFGEIAEVEMFVDRTLSENEIIAFNPGVHDKSIIMKFSAYQQVTNCQLFDFSVQ